MRRLMTFLIVLLISIAATMAQGVSTYSFATSSGTYSPITGGTMLINGTSTMDSWASTAQTIPSFTFNGVAYTKAYVTSNGILTLGGSAPSAYTSTGISLKIGSGIAICPFSADLDRATTSASTEIRWKTVGNEVIFQWQQVKRYGATESFDMQARLNTNNGVIIFIYSLNTGQGSSTSYFPQVGIRTSATDYNNRLVASGTEDWASSLSGSSNTSTCRFTSASPAKGFTSGLTYTFTPPVPCTGTPDPDNTLSSLGSVCSGTNFTLSLQNVTSGTGVTYQWQSSPNGNAPWTNIGTSSATHTLSQTVATYYRCAVTCSNSGLIGTSNSLLEPMSLGSVPYAEGFLTTTTPSCWNITGWTIGSTRGVTGNPGNNIYKNFWSSSTTATFTSGLIGSVASGMFLSFDYKLANYDSPYDPPASGSGNFVVSVSKDGGATYDVLETVGNNGVAGWQTKYYNMSSYNGFNVMIKIVGNWTSGDYDLAFDNIKIETPPTCLNPTALNVTSVTGNSASINWTASTSNPSLGYDIYYSTSSVAPTSGTTPTGSVGAGVTTYPTGAVLSATTQYYYWVRSNCGAGDLSSWAAGTPFTTPCIAVSSFPYTESFASTLNPCWSVSEGVAGASYHWATSTTDGTNGVTGSQAGTHFAFLNIYNASATYNPYYLKTSNFTLGVVAKQISYYYYLGNDGYKTTPVPLTLQISADGGSTWTDLYQHTTANSTFSTTSALTGWHQNTVNLSAYTNQTVTFRFASNSNYGSGYCNQGIDEVVIENVPSCLTPTALNATSVTSNSASINWTASVSNPSGGYDIYYSTTSTAPLAGTTPTASVAAGVTTYPTGSVLAAATQYYYWVRSNCGGGDLSSWAAGSPFVTSCALITSFSQNFDGVTAPALPVCWAKYLSPSYTFETVTTYATSPNTAPNCVQLYSSNATLPADAPLLVSPILSNLNSGTHQLRFFAKGASTNTSVVIGTMTDPTNSSTFTTFQTVTGLSTSAWTEYTVNFASYAGSDQYIAFRHPLTTTYNYIYIDDVVWEAPPTCLAPTAVIASAITTTTATISWTAASPAPANGYQYEVRASGLAGSGPTGLTTSGTTAAGVVTANISGLSASKTYYVFVRSDCSAGDYSAWTSSYFFPTQCGAITLPYTENFEAVTTPAIPNCMTVTNDNSDLESWETSTSYSRSAPNSVYISYNSSIAMNDWFFAPGINLTPGTYIVSFWFRGSGSFPEKLEVKWGNAPNAAGMSSTAIFSNTNIASSTYAEGTGSFTVSTAGVYYVGWHGFSDADEFYLVVDDISIVASTPGIWSGAISNNWSNTANWTSGNIPTASDDVVITASAHNPYVDLAPATPAVCNNLTINTGASLTIASGKALTANGTTTLNGAQSLIIKTEGSFIDNGMSYVGGGSAKVEKTLAAARWWYVGSPLNSSITASTAFGALGGTTGVGKRMYYYTEGNNGTYTSLTPFTDVYNLSTTQLQGFVFKDYSGATNADFTGTLNTGTIARTNLSRGGTTFQGYTLFCNPYPSALDLGTDEFSTGTTTSGITVSNLETSVWYNNGSSFCTYNWTSGLGQGTPEPNSKIPAMQAFWVRVQTAPGSFNIPNTARTHSSNAFYKTTSTSNVFRMNISDGTHSDEAVVGFYPNALNILENYDSEKMFYTNEDVPQTYTLTTDAVETAINGQAELTFNEERIIPLGFATPVSGTFTFAATNLTDFDASVSVYIEDLQLGIVQDLRQNASYTFSSGLVDNASRFNLHFGGLLTDISTSDENHVYVYADENNVYVNTAEKCTMEIYNVLGEKIMSQQLENGLNKIQLNVVKGIYVVKVQNSTIAVNKKIYIGQ